MLRGHSNYSVWLAAGLGVGALVGILFAPKAGHETRRAIADGVEDGLDRAASLGRSARRSVRKSLRSGKRLLTRKKEQVNTAIDAARVLVNKAS